MVGEWVMGVRNSRAGRVVWHGRMEVSLKSLQGSKKGMVQPLEYVSFLRMKLSHFFPQASIKFQPFYFAEIKALLQYPLPANKVNSRVVSRVEGHPGKGI